MYMKLKAADRETAVAAFMEGAGLIEKGAATHWYSCRRKAPRRQRRCYLPWIIVSTAVSFR
jgi:hypothetical protein